MSFLGYIQRAIGVNRIASYSSEAKSSAADPDSPVEIANPFKRDEKVCLLCSLNITPDYKNARMLSQFQSPYTGKIYGRHITGLCKERQRQVEFAIQKSQASGFMPLYFKSPEFLEDPKLYDAEKPIRPHPY